MEANRDMLLFQRINERTRASEGRESVIDGTFGGEGLRVDLCHCVSEGFHNNESTFTISLCIHMLFSASHRPYVDYNTICYDRRSSSIRQELYTHDRTIVTKTDNRGIYGGV